MRKFVISVAAMMVFAALVPTAPAKADFNFGPVQNGNQCWTYTPNSKEFGYWGACPQPASVAAPTHHKSHHHAS
jgi:D-alanyl-D-alanine dipeptidase